MRKTLLRLAAIIMAFAIIIGATAARPEPGTKVGAAFPDGIAFDFGTISEKATAPSHTFTFTNTGTSALAIIWAKPSCGCTVPKYPSKPLEPGQSGVITVTFSPRGQRGNIDKTVRLRLKNGDKKSEDITLRITGVVVPDPK